MVVMRGKKQPRRIGVESTPGDYHCRNGNEEASPVQKLDLKKNWQRIARSTLLVVSESFLRSERGSKQPLGVRTGGKLSKLNLRRPESEARYGASRAPQARKPGWGRCFSMPIRRQRLCPTPRKQQRETDPGGKLPNEVGARNGKQVSGHQQGPA
jgi:hypothetical protein